MTMETHRLFFALATPETVRAQIVPLMHALQDSGADVKWEPASKLHCTVKFLGDTGSDLFEPLKEKASQVTSSCPVLAVRYRGLGCFPSPRDPRIVWAGMEETSGSLANMHRSLEAALEELGFEPERRAFHPHITLGRVRGRRNLTDLIRLLESLTLECEPALLTEMLLMRSQLHPSGSVYTALQAFPFRTR
jgi:2'-5' RNA ligase